MARFTPIHRQHCTDAILRWIHVKGCWHLDVWLYACKDRAQDLLIRAATSAGGREQIGEAWFRLHRDRVFNVYMLTPLAATLDAVQRAGYSETYLAARPVAAAMGGHETDVFWRLLYPLVNLWPRGDYRRKSIAFHMIKPVGVDDPCEGIENLYGVSGRAERDGRRVLGTPFA